MGSSSSDDPWWYVNRQRSIRIDNDEIRAFVARLGRDLAPGREFAVVVGSEDAVRQANRRFRNVRGSTDVLSFPDGQDGRLGDILIAARKAEQQATRQGHSVESEVKILILHGLLHLLGYDHETDRGEMRAREAQLHDRYGLSPGLVERATQ